VAQRSIAGRGSAGELCVQTYEMLKPHEQVMDLDGVPVRTVSLEGLLLTKQSLRPQDVQDSLVLRRAIEEAKRQ
jgi:hypothetical protein